jgi:hypothetical protein
VAQHDPVRTAEQRGWKQVNSMKTINLIADNCELEFYQLPLSFYASDIANIFARKNNKTLAQTIMHRHYQRLSSEVFRKYPSLLGEPLGDFLFSLKSLGDIFYKRFLNLYGDERYCIFRLEHDLGLRGLYCYVVSGEIAYIGRCRDSFGKRINQGYGQISPKNCYLDGQATNCHLNSLINASRDEVGFYICPLTNSLQIVQLERQLIGQLQPFWNISLR